MDELRFTLKCFAFAAVLLVFSQLKTKSGTIETDIQAALVNSQTAEFVNKAADGGVELIRNATTFLKAKINGEKKTQKSRSAEPQPLEAKVSEVREAAGQIKKAVLEKTASIKADDKTVIDTVDETVEEVE